MWNTEQCPDCHIHFLGHGDGKCSNCYGTGDGSFMDQMAANVGDAIGTGGDELRVCDVCGGRAVCQTCGGEGLVPA